MNHEVSLKEYFFILTIIKRSSVPRRVHSKSPAYAVPAKKIVIMSLLAKTFPLSLV